MGINTVSVVGPRSDQQKVEKPKKDTITQILEGLQIANGVLGIGVNFTTIQKHMAEQGPLDDKAAGIQGVEDRQKAQEAGLQVVDKGTPGAQEWKQRTGPGDDGVTTTYLKKPDETPKSPLGSFVKTMNAKGQPVQKWVENGSKEELPVYITPPNPQSTVPQQQLDLAKQRFAFDKEQKTAKATAAAAPSEKKTFAAMSPDDQIMVKSLAGDNSRRLASRNAMQQDLENYKNAKTEDEKVKIGQGMLKQLNSQTNPDAIGSEESKRIGGFLEYKRGNLFEPGSFIGRDLDLFENQVADKIAAMDRTLSENQKVIDVKMGRAPAAQPAANGATSTRFDQAVDSNQKKIDQLAPPNGKPGPGSIIKVGEKTFRVGADGDTLEEMTTTATGGRR